MWVFLDSFQPQDVESTIFTTPTFFNIYRGAPLHGTISKICRGPRDPCQLQAVTPAAAAGQGRCINARRQELTNEE